MTSRRDWNFFAFTVKQRGIWSVH